MTGGGAGGHATASADARERASRLVAGGVHGCALTWVDNSGITRVKAVPADRFADAVEHGVGMSPVFDVFLLDDSITESRYVGGPDGDLRLHPDPRRLTELAAQPGWAWAPVDRYDQEGGPHPCCQRQFARRMYEEAAAAGFDVRMGFETEWVATVAGEGGAEGAGGGPAYATTGPAYGMSRLVDLSAYLGELLRAFQAQGVRVLQLHPEYAAGQFEVSVAPADPVTTADLAVLVRETIRAVTGRHGLVPVFGPVAEAGAVGNGRHLHTSLWREGRNLCRGGDGAAGLTAEGEAFFAGVLRELPALMAIGAPSAASYLRLQPSHWSGAYHCWGVENREAALRLVPGPSDDPCTANGEVKCFDAAANPYLVTGSVIAAGLAGVRDRLTLPEPVAGDPARGHRAQRLPCSLPEAVKHFQDSAVLRTALGDPLFEALLAVRRAESELFAQATAEELAHAVRHVY
ncbi:MULTISPECIES: glutamine synthetase family protein [unclassified Streptomyces]|uniref:glutamine synthetase family protein n=1 Tax=unclassified Streptomyces TaxID=2593676 RepID=UPI00278C4803|nr:MULTISPECIES: glutamine synthetase family protein [unclassified Streptomyces]